MNLEQLAEYLLDRALFKAKLRGVRESARANISLKEKKRLEGTITAIFESNREDKVKIKKPHYYLDS